LTVLRLSFVFLAIALIAGGVEFGNVAGDYAWGGTRFIFAFFFVLALVSFMAALKSRPAQA
jgi:uncharacterized membrane protein YtjA (UPF0391 family)